VPAPFAGTIDALRAEPGSTIKVGDVILTYREMGKAATAVPALEGPMAAAKTPTQRKAAAVTQPDGRGSAQVPVKAAPSVRLLARKLGVDLSQMTGSGPQGRILTEDLVRHAQLPRVAEVDQPASSRPALDLGRPGTRIKIQGVRRKIAERMVHSKRTVPHYSYVDECDVTELVRVREGLREPYEKAGVRLTYLAFFVKAVAMALKEVPLVNASVDDEAGEIVLHDRYHIGIATATPTGLIVPVIHEADRKSLLDVAREVERLSNEARTGRIKVEDLRGGTFTVTSIGNIGGLISTPVINHPEVGIMGVGKIVKRPIYDGAGQIRPADMLYLSFSFDHRVLDGAVGATFGNAVIRRLQNAVTLAAGL
jgi:pyruvate dehydrogenase E2 component (dihydrolipoamide acetyltransferase)/2-oxoisovalerate dehydrogenase E2 component (dihydrolipoyl transacylase)